MKKGIIWKIMFVFIFCISLSYSKGKSTENRNNREITEKNVTQINDYAYELYKKGNLSESKKILEDILNKFPKRIVVNLNYADILWKLGEKTKAEKFYTEYIKLLIKSDKLEKNLLNDKSIKFANGITLKETKSGYINKDNKKDYILEYSNIETEKAKDMGPDELYEMYKTGKNSSCLKFFISEGEDYKIFDSCKLIIPVGIEGTGGSYGEESSYEIKNNMVVIRDMSMAKLSGFKTYFIELSYKNNNMMIDSAYVEGYSKIKAKEGDDFKVSKSPKKHINKPIEKFDVDTEISELFEKY